MFLPGVSFRVKLIGIAVLAILTASLAATALAAINQVLAEGYGQTQLGRHEAGGFAGSPGQAPDQSAVVNGLKFVCPFH